MFSCLSAMPYEGNEAKHFLVSIMTEESLKIAKDSDNNINMFAIKPILRACIVIFTERLTALEDIDSSELIIKQINNYNELISTLNGLIDNIKE
jgi:hypothetical protein